MDNDDAERGYTSLQRRYTSMSQKKVSFSSRKDTRRKKIVFGIVSMSIVLSICSIYYFAHIEDFPPVIFHLHNEEKLKEFEPIRITDEFVASQGDKWHVSHYLLLFSEDPLYRKDIEGITVLVPEHREEVVVAFWQYGWLVPKRYGKEELRDGLHVYLECGTHTAFPDHEITKDRVDNIPLGLQETTLVSMWGLGSSTKPEQSDYHTHNIEWEDITYSLATGINKVESFLDTEIVGNPRTLRLELLRRFSQHSSYYYLIDAGSKIINIRTLIQDQKNNYGFAPGRLIYISESTDPAEGNWITFQYVLKTSKAEAEQNPMDLGASETASLIYFLTGLSLHDTDFWVNLMPEEPERIIDSNLGATMIGKIMLEADFQMKKDFCFYENPCESSTGEVFWDSLDQKRKELVKKCMEMYPGEIQSVDNVLFATATRYWIEPDTITAYGDATGIFIENATLTIKSEFVLEYSAFEITDQSSSVSQDCRDYLAKALEEYGRYLLELEEELILPLVVKDVNTGEQYADLRQVYHSLVLAQWYKSQGSQSLFSGLVNTNHVNTIPQWEDWDYETIWKEYADSFNKGECFCEKEQKTATALVTWTYQGGGINLTDTPRIFELHGPLNDYLRDLAMSVQNTPIVTEGEEVTYGNTYCPSKERIEKLEIRSNDYYFINLSRIVPYDLKQNENTNREGEIAPIRKIPAFAILYILVMLARIKIIRN